MLHLIMQAYEDTENATIRSETSALFPFGNRFIAAAYQLMWIIQKVPNMIG